MSGYANGEHWFNVGLSVGLLDFEIEMNMDKQSGGIFPNYRQKQVRMVHELRSSRWGFPGER